VSDTAAIPKLKLRADDLRDDGRVPGKVRRFTNLGNWLKYADKSVTRAELWEVLNRYEAGRVAMESHQFQLHCEKVLAHLAAQRWYRRLWRWMRRAPAPEAPKLPTVPLEEM
jgi:hypothetical protein